MMFDIIISISVIVLCICAIWFAHTLMWVIRILNRLYYTPKVSGAKYSVSPAETAPKAAPSTE